MNPWTAGRAEKPLTSSAGIGARDRLEARVPELMERLPPLSTEKKIAARGIARRHDGTLARNGRESGTADNERDG